MGLVETLKARAIGLKVLTGANSSIDTTKGDERMMLGLLAVMAGFECEAISERAKAGMQATMQPGRPRKQSPDEIAVAREFWRGTGRQLEVAKRLDVAASPLRETLRQQPAADTPSMVGELGPSAHNPIQ